MHEIMSRDLTPGHLKLKGLRCSDLGNRTDIVSHGTPYDKIIVSWFAAPVKAET